MQMKGALHVVGVSIDKGALFVGQDTLAKVLHLKTMINHLNQCKNSDRRFGIIYITVDN